MKFLIMKHYIYIVKETRVPNGRPILKVWWNKFRTNIKDFFYALKLDYEYFITKNIFNPESCYLSKFNPFTKPSQNLKEQCNSLLFS